jgi:hypothetical protein
VTGAGTSRGAMLCPYSTPKRKPRNGSKIKSVSASAFDRGVTVVRLSGSMGLLGGNEGGVSPEGGVLSICRKCSTPLLAQDMGHCVQTYTAAHPSEVRSARFFSTPRLYPPRVPSRFTTR